MSPIDEDAVEQRLQSDVDAGISGTATVGPEFFLTLFKQMRIARAKLADSVTLKVVATAADLPANAGPREFFRVASDPTSLYIGNGPNQKLSRITATLLP